MTGGADVGRRLIDDARVAAVHLTGSIATHDAIVFSSGDGGAANKAAGRQILDPFRPLPRSVLHRELALSPKPAWFVTNKTAAVTGRRLTAFAASPARTRLPGIFASALRG